MIDSIQFRGVVMGISFQSAAVGIFLRNTCAEMVWEYHFDIIMKEFQCMGIEILFDFLVYIGNFVPKTDFVNS